MAFIEMARPKYRGASISQYLCAVCETLCTSYPTRRFCVAYSGGLDSHVLLHLLAQLVPQRLRALHINHGIQAHSDIWARHCAATCAQLSIALEIVRVEVGQEGGPEAAARQARYEAFGQHLGSEEILVLGHHRDDQAETVLLQLLRGAGVHGLAAMPAWAPLGSGWLARPLLDVEQATLRAYAKEHALCWIDDPSNADPALARNYLRHQVIPTLRQRWPAMTRSLARSARHCAEAATLIDTEAATLLSQCAEGTALRIDRFNALDEASQRQLLRYWLRQQGYTVPSQRQLAQLPTLLTAPADSSPLLAWSGCELRRYRNALHAMPPLESFNPAECWPCVPQANLRVVGIGSLRLMLQSEQRGIDPDRLAGQTLSWRLRRGGERFHLHRGGHSQSLKALFQAQGVPPWVRQRVPLLYVGDTLVWVALLGVHPDWQADGSEDTLLPQWKNPYDSASFLRLPQSIFDE